MVVPPIKSSTGWPSNQGPRATATRMALLMLLSLTTSQSGCNFGGRASGELRPDLGMTMVYSHRSFFACFCWMQKNECIDWGGLNGVMKTPHFPICHDQIVFYSFLFRGNGHPKKGFNATCMYNAVNRRSHLHSNSNLYQFIYPIGSVYGISTYIWLVFIFFTVRLILWIQKVNGCKLLEYNWSNWLKHLDTISIVAVCGCLWVPTW